MNYDLLGKTALITGSGRNLGAATAKTLAKAGANVVINVSTNMDEASKVVQEITSSGGNAIAVQADISKPDDVKRLFTKTRERFGGVDILINNAAVRPKNSLLNIDLAEWATVLQTNLTGAFQCIQEAASDMMKKGWGRIINISGVDALQAITNRAHNCAAKTGLLGLTQASAVELGKHGITVNSILPGIMDTSRDTTKYANWPPAQEWIDQNIPCQRLGSLEDFANACLFLVSKSASYITGQKIALDGGLTSRLNFNT